METNTQTALWNLTTSGCEINPATQLKIEKCLSTQLAQFPGRSEVSLVISKPDENLWNFDVSLRYNRGHIAILKSGTTLTEVIDAGLAEFTKDIKAHKFQYAIETFHFDKTNEYDYFTEVSTESFAQPKRRLSTLVVEDDPAAAAILRATLKSIGCDVAHHDTPRAALKAIGEIRYDLLVLDWNLPYMKGSDFLIAADQLLQKADLAGQALRQIPVVICTSLPLTEISLPPVAHFFFYNHWHKGMPFSSVFGSVDETTKRILDRQQFAA